MKPTPEQKARIIEEARRQRAAVPNLRQLAAEMGLSYWEVRKIRNAELQRLLRASKLEGKAACAQSA